MKRCFAYGCSFTKWNYPTWADFIGVNFDEYHNMGRGGCDHDYILDKIFDDYHRFKFDSNTDTIFIATTGLNRLSWYHGNSGYNTVGDLYNWQNSIKQLGITDHKKLDGFFEIIWNLDWACLRSANAIIKIHKFLSLLNINFSIFQGMKFNFINTNRLELNPNIIEKLDFASSLLESYIPLDNFRCSYEHHAFNENDGHIDGHPGQPRHLAFVKQYFPQYITEKSQKFYNETVNEFFFKNYQTHIQRRNAYYDFLLKNYSNINYE